MNTSRKGYRPTVMNSVQEILVLDLWSRCESELGLKKSDRLFFEQFDPYRRIYFKENLVVKIEFPDRVTSRVLRTCDLIEEFELYQFCSSIKGVAKAVELHRGDGYNAIFIERAKGSSIEVNTISWLKVFRTVAQLAGISLNLVRKGISHNDFACSNLFLDDGNLTIIDFDQATRTTTARALMLNYFGGLVNHGAVKASIFCILKEKFKSILPTRVLSFYRRARGRFVEWRTPHLLPQDASSPKGRGLLDAWKIAQRSFASAPGRRLAYYSAVLEGMHFPGERPWSARWSVLRGLLNFENQRVLELGCNMGLLSSHLMKNSGCSATLGVDVDADILDSARLISEALDVHPEFECVNFDSPNDWETRLIQFNPDIVFALNLLNWVEEKERFLKFLGEFSCVIFEGHDSFEIEEQRLKSVGFVTIEFICQTERSRPLMVCKR